MNEQGGRAEQARIAHNKVIWASRRGMLELDIVLEPFARNRYTALDADAQRSYRALLECEDQQLFDWLLQKREVDVPALRPIIASILEHHGASVNGSS